MRVAIIFDFEAKKELQSALGLAHEKKEATASTSSLALTVFAVPAASLASLVVILVDIDRWKASDFTYSSTSSISLFSQSSVTTSYVVSSSRTRSSRIDASSRRSTASASR